MKLSCSRFEFGPCLVLTILALTFQSRAQVNTYRVPKEKPSPAITPAADATTKPLTWSTPSGWKELPGDTMRVATFTIAGEGGQQAQVTIVPILGKGGAMGDNVNRWRGQLGLGPLDADTVSKQIGLVEVGPDRGQLYEVTGNLANGQQQRATRLVVATLSQADTAWFFKMMGDDSLVAAQKLVFIHFLKSVLFNAAMPPQDLAAIHKGIAGAGNFSISATTASSATSHPEWKAPSNWQSVTASPMLVAKFQISGGGDAKADVNISTSPGIGGGASANINRWRAQVGLGPVDDAGLRKLITTVNVAGTESLLVDLSGTSPESGDPNRIVALIVPLSQQTWFFKLMGPPSIVEKEKQSLIDFAQTVHFSDAH